MVGRPELTDSLPTAFLEWGKIDKDTVPVSRGRDVGESRGWSEEVK